MRLVQSTSSARRSEVAGFLLLLATAFLFIALITDGLQGTSTREIDGWANVDNKLGMPGALAAGALTFLFGHAAHALYCLTAIWGCMLIVHLPLNRLPSRILGMVILTSSIAGLLQLDMAPTESNKLPGGAVGAFVLSLVQGNLGLVAANIVILVMAFVGLLMATEFLFVHFFGMLRFMFAPVFRGVFAMFFVRKPVIGHREKVFTEEEMSKLRLPEQVELFSAMDVEQAEAEETEPVRAPKRDFRTIRVRAQNGSYALDEDGLAGGDVDAPFHSVARIDVDRIAEPEQEAYEPLDDPFVHEAETLPSRGAAMDLAGSASASVSKPKKAAGLRRKFMTDEELPDDYVYPKRYKIPSLELFDLPPKPPVIDLRETLRRTSQLLEETLLTFGIEARVTDITRGPTLTRFELEPAPGIKVSRFTSLTDDIALALKAHGVRVEAPIPGKGRIGIEVPNEEREPVVIRELIESKVYARHAGKLRLALGKDIAGDVYIADLATMPHLLVAGATGAGKTVCVKSLLASLLMTRPPEELQLMLIDPKMVELSIFNDIPHLITPVVTDPKKAASSLNWLITEMEERYRLFAHLRVRNIDVYNESVENGEIEVDENEGGESGSMNIIRKLPYIVCIIDELADLMMLARAEVEDAIARLAQLARAVGIHLILATQRPSVDVLTGVIKANFPARLSFQVSSRVDSRCILDEIGAERLIGRGDMLYLPAGQSKPVRIQCAFVSDDEMNRLIAYLKTQAPPQYRDEIEKFGKKESAAEITADESDELFDEAVQVVLETGQASISMVQRRLRVGYTRAARLIDMMEMRGIVGPHLGSKAREILVDYTRKGEVT